MKTIMVIGAGMLQTPLIKRARDLGYRTVSVDLDKNAEGFQYSDFYRPINIVDQVACLDYAKEMNINGVLTAATDYGVLTSSYIAQQLRLPGLNFGVAKIIKNKFSVRKILSEHKIDNINQYYEIAEVSAVELIKDRLQYPVMVKPSDGSGSKAVAKATNYLELIYACNAAIEASQSHKAVIETFVVGQEYGVESFVLNGQIYVLGILKKMMTNPPYYAELEHCMPSGLPIEIDRKVKQVVRQAIKALEINFGSVNMDVLIMNENQVCIVDIGARMGGNLIGSHIIPFAVGMDYMGNMLSACVGEAASFEIRTDTRCVASSIMALTPGRVKKVPDITEFKEQAGVIDIIFKLKEGDIIREYRNNLDGCGYVVVTAKTIAIAQQYALDLKNQIDGMIERE